MQELRLGFEKNLQHEREMPWQSEPGLALTAHLLGSLRNRKFSYNTRDTSVHVRW